MSDQAVDHNKQVDDTCRRALQYRLYPTAAQESLLESHFAECCRLYNAAVQERRDAYRISGRQVRFYDQDRQLKEIRAAGDIGVVNFTVCRNVLRRVDFAFSSFFRRLRTRRGKAGYPRFKSVQRWDSLTFPQYGSGVKLRGRNRLYAQGIGDIKIKLHRPVVGEVKNVTVKCVAGRWYAILSVKTVSNRLALTGRAVGIDLGLSSFIALSSGESIRNPRCAARATRLLRIAQRRLCRRKRGSNGRRKAIRLVQRSQTRARNQRSDVHHKTAAALVRCHGLIAVEDLNVRGLSRSMLSKSVHDAGWASFLNKLTYKAESAGRVLVRVNPAGTSQTCSGCGIRVQKTLAERRHRCPSCGLDIDRDVNAARNILALGLSVAGGTWDTGPCVPAEAA